MRSAFALSIAAVCAALAAGPGCKIVYDDDAGKAPAAGGTDPHAANFDPKAWAASVWSAKVLPLFDKSAVELTPVLAAIKEDLDAAGKKYGRRADAEGSPWTFLVKAKGKVVSVDTESRAGTMVVAVDGPGGPVEVTLQVGPVVNGTAIRDSLPFFSFGDVTNQIAFAQVARALNDRAVADIQPAIEPVKAPGTEVVFSGAMNLSTADDEIQITPVTLKKAP